MRNRLAWMTPCAVGALFGSNIAAAQENTTATLEEVTVTATRVSDSVNRVPLAVTAQTQRALDQQGIRTIADLEATVPSLRLSGQEGSGLATISIRGIRQTSATAATTGFYLDETALQKRAAAGFASANGTPIPPLFDLERIEVLRGPQGTLFGGGSEGGTIRYIQPEPGLSHYTSYARAQWMQTKNGDPSYEAGVAVGGPIVQDKLGFRASVFSRTNGGYIDLTDYRNGTVYEKNANNNRVRMGRLALAWAPTESSKVTLSYFASHDETDSLGNGYDLDIPGTLSVPSLCFDVTAISSLPVGHPARVLPTPFAAGPGCAGRAGQAGVYVTQPYTVGPLNLDRFQSLVLGPTPTSTNVQVATLNAQWSINDDLQLTAISSYIQDRTTGQSPQNFHQGLLSYRAVGNASYVVPGSPAVVIPGGVGFNPNITSTPNGLGLGAYLETNTRNTRNGISEELRLASSADRTVSYVAGAYFARTNAFVGQRADASNLGFIQMTGLGIQQRFGVPDPGFFAQLYESDQDKEIAGFGNVTVRLGESLRVTGGVRVTHIKTTFEQANYGPNGYNVAPSLLDGTLVVGEIAETPITPKLSVQYLFNPEAFLYATASKGFRAGGVNQVFSSAGQGQLFGQYGLTKAILPKTYASDSVWNYELGGKFGFLEGRAQINAAVYELRWKDVQTNVFIGGDGFVANVPTARSRGAEAEAQWRPVRALTFNAAASYIKAEYTSTLRYPGARGLDLFAAQDGQSFAQPKWSADIGARLDIPLGAADNTFYARLDYRWLDKFDLAPPGSANYTPDSRSVPEQQNVNLRLGVEHGSFDVNLFVYNLTDEDKGAPGGGRSACTNADCSAFLNYNVARTVAAPVPRQIGLQVAFRY
ncbi:MAG: TonB-dependent receptor [Gammaproteobacteria bacterium]